MTPLKKIIDFFKSYYSYEISYLKKKRFLSFIEKNNQDKIVQYLETYGHVLFDKPNNYKNDIFLHSVISKIHEKKHEEILDIIFSCPHVLKADVLNQYRTDILFSGENVVHQLIGHNDLDILKKIAQVPGINFNSQGALTGTPLNIICESKFVEDEENIKYEMVKTLIAGGANVLIKDIFNKTVLFRCVQANRLKITQLLIKNWTSKLDEDAFLESLNLGHGAIATLFLDNENSFKEILFNYDKNLSKNPFEISSLQSKLRLEEQLDNKVNSKCIKI